MIDGGTGIRLVSSSENTLRNNTITKRVRGIQLTDSHENIASWNIISGGSFLRIYLEGSKRNIIRVNEVSDCREFALGFWDNASENLFYPNNFMDNKRNAEEYHSGRLPGYPINIWDNGTVRNYWSDYYGTDSDGDGIGDTPYVINEDNQDNHPLMEPTIIPEFPSWSLLLLLMLTFTVVSIFYRRNL